MDSHAEHERVVLGPQGRLVVPARYRKLLNLQPGEPMIMRLVDGALVLERPADVRERLRARFRNVNQRGTSLAQELIRERRKEARRESPR